MVAANTPTKPLWALLASRPHLGFYAFEDCGCYIDSNADQPEMLMSTDEISMVGS